MLSFDLPFKTFKSSFTLTPVDTVSHEVFFNETSIRLDNSG